MKNSRKALYIVVVDDVDGKDAIEKDSFRYTRPVLQSTLQLMGCKARHAFKISRRVFDVIKNAEFSDVLDQKEKRNTEEVDVSGQNTCCLVSDEVDENQPFELYKKRTSVAVKRETFLNVVCDALADYNYVGNSQREDLLLACRIRERKESVTVLLCGTSGCGKSTLSSLLGNRLGITTVVSTDSIRHMMRSFVDEKDNPLLWASTYHAGEYLDAVAVAEAKAKRKAKKRVGPKDEPAIGLQEGNSDCRQVDDGSNVAELLGPRQMAVEGFKAQSEMVIDSLDRLLTSWEERKESVIVEGVHLSLNFVMGLMKKHPSVIPFMVYITNEEKHLERFAVRAKYMTLEPAKNKYVKYIRNIRTIQDYLCKRADKHLVPKVNNTNVDKSVAAIHATVFSCLRRRESGESLYDPRTNTVAIVDDEYRNQCAANSLSSKGMFQLIQRKGSSRNLMALLYNDGTIAKAWPVDAVDVSGKPIFSRGVDNGMQDPNCVAMQIGKAEPVNLQFGHFGISAWPSDGATSHAGSFDESRADGTDTGSKYYSSCCSSPRLSEGPAKELKEEHSVHGSDEEVEDPHDPDIDEDLSDDNEKDLHEEVGSVDEESTKSDEEYDDLAMQDTQASGYQTDVEEEFRDRIMPGAEGQASQPLKKYNQNLDLFHRSVSRCQSDSQRPYLSPSSDEAEHRLPSSETTRRPKKRSLSIPGAGSPGLFMADVIRLGGS